MLSFASTVSLCCITVQLVLAERLISEEANHLALEADFEQFEEAELGDRGPEECTEEVCMTFVEEGTCSCTQFLIDEEKKARIAARARGSLFRIVQSMRYLTDHKEEESIWAKLNLFQKYKHMKIFSASFKDFEFVQGAADNLPSLREFAETPVKKILNGNDVPAGSFPITVEILDGDVTTTEFLGEAGVPLQLGESKFTLGLRPNEARNPTTAAEGFGELGVVVLKTNVAYNTSDTAPCSFHGDMECTKVMVEVTVERAHSLNNKMDTISKIDPIAVVRIKKFDDEGSTKDTTREIQDDDKPVWNAIFTHTWEAMVIDIEGREDKVLWTLDEENLLEQFEGCGELAIKQKVLGGKDCKQLGAKKTEKQKEVCDFLTEVSERQTGSNSAISKVKAKLGSKEDQETLTRMEEELKKHDATAFMSVSSLLDSGSQRGGMAVMRASRHARERRRNGGGGGARRQAPAQVDGKVVFFIFLGIFCFLLLLR